MFRHISYSSSYEWGIATSYSEARSARRRPATRAWAGKYPRVRACVQRSVSSTFRRKHERYRERHSPRVRRRCRRPGRRRHGRRRHERHRRGGGRDHRGCRPARVPDQARGSHRDRRGARLRRPRHRHGPGRHRRLQGRCRGRRDHHRPREAARGLLLRHLHGRRLRRRGLANPRRTWASSGPPRPTS